jgi:hypothetical protein
LDFDLARNYCRLVFIRGFGRRRKFKSGVI